MFPMKKLPVIPQNRQPFLYLAMAGILIFLLITMVAVPSYLGYYLAETYMIVPCLLFMGYVLREKPNAFARRRLLLAMMAILWFAITQVLHKLSDMETQKIGTVLSVYLLAFPFAALTDDRENTGIRWIGKLLVAAPLVLVGYSVLLLLNMVPSGWGEYLYWDGSRLLAFWHPNITACYLMMGMGFAVVFLLQAQKLVTKVLLAAAVVVQFLVMSLTNCRTTLLMTGALFGGIVFFLIFRGGWKQLVLGLLAAAVVLVGSFKLSGTIYRWNEDRLLSLAGVPAEVELPVQPESAAYAELEIYQYQVEDDGRVVMVTENPQGSLENDMRSLNGRTDIWKSALKAIRDDKKLALWGTEYPGTVISVYNHFPVEHGHNSWMEVLLRTGIPGLLMALIFTAVSVVSAGKLLLHPATELWKKIIAMMTMCVMVAGFLEPYLFATNFYYHAIDFPFFFCTGYLDYWCRPGQQTE